MKLIVGLGNPGKHYVNSRHNIGFQCINAFAREHGIDLSKRQSKARVGTGQIAGQKVILAKPGTFMNLSGESVAPLASYYGIDLADILVVYDDVDFPLGTFRIREKGSSGGHNGIESIMQHLGSQAFPRIRVGIGPVETDGPAQSMRSPKYVLGDFTRDERAVVDEVCTRVVEAIDCILSEGIATAMNRYNSSS
ncbi:MAG: aminoacyl-tRNA hydrolase [Dehalococcoidia bacterium]